MKKLVLLVLLFAAAADAAKKPWLGMALKLRDAASGGKFLYVAHAPEGTPAFTAGVRPADLITAIDGRPIAFRDDLDILEFTSSLRPGQLLTLRVVRAGKPHAVKVTVGVLPPEYEAVWARSLERARAARSRGR